MNKLRKLTILTFAAGILTALPALADVAIGNEKITSGTEIKVLGPGPDLQAIIDGISDADANKPYLIKLGPGVYVITANPSTSKGLVMKPYVSIMGSGQGVTILRGAIAGSALDATAAIVSLADATALTDLGVENTGDGQFAIAVWNNAASPPRIQNVSAAAFGLASNNYGVRNDFSAPTMINVGALAAGAIEFNFAVRNASSTATMVNIVATAIGGAAARGVYLSGSSGTLVNVAASASGGTDSNAGLRIAGGSPQIASSSLTGTGTGAVGVLLGSSPGPRITDTRIVGGVGDDDAATTNCRDTYDENLLDVAC